MVSCLSPPSTTSCMLSAYRDPSAADAKPLLFLAQRAALYKLPSENRLPRFVERLSRSADREETSTALIAGRRSGLRRSCSLRIIHRDANARTLAARPRQI